MPVITDKIDLFGPVDGSAMLRGVYNGNAFHWPGTCVTAHQAVFRFSEPHLLLKRATWRVCWSIVSPQGIYNTGRYITRLVHADNGPTNLVEMAQIDSNNNNPINPDHRVFNRPIDITAQMNQLIAVGVDKTVGFQITGDNCNMVEMSSVRLELEWIVPVSA